MDEIPSSKHSSEEISSSERSLIHETYTVAEDHAENKGIENKGTDDSTDIVFALARVETEKRLTLIKAWEENEKTKAENEAYKKLFTIGAHENTKRALVEVQLKQIEEELEKEKAEKTEKIKNKISILHQKAEAKRAAVEAKRGEEFIKIDQKGAKHRKNETTPTKYYGCFRC